MYEIQRLQISFPFRDNTSDPLCGCIDRTTPTHTHVYCNRKIKGRPGQKLKKRPGQDVGSAQKKLEWVAPIGLVGCRFFGQQPYRNFKVWSAYQAIGICKRLGELARGRRAILVASRACNTAHNTGRGDTLWVGANIAAAGNQKVAYKASEDLATSRDSGIGGLEEPASRCTCIAERDISTPVLNSFVCCTPISDASLNIIYASYRNVGTVGVAWQVWWCFEARPDGAWTPW